MDVIDGGAFCPDMTDFWLGGGRSGHTAGQKGRPVSQADLDATNRLQETDWQINRDVADVLRQAYETGHPCIGVPAERPKMGTKATDEEWAALTDKEKKDRGAKRRKLREEIDAWDGAVAEFGGIFGTVFGTEDSPGDYGHERLWMSWGHDSRLRRYPRVSGGPSPQGSGASRSLLRFGTGVALGETGHYWLCVRLATAAGLDKLKLDERSAWVSTNIEHVLASAQDPLNCDWWWKDEKGETRDDPWAVLATAFEIHDALNSDNPSAFLSQLPVQVDGTCNGLQHLSAMGLDPVGALATNLTSDVERHDIYLRVADAVRRIVELDLSSDAVVAAKAPGGKEIMVSKADLARGWIDKIDRSLVKRGTMTTPYGVTARGMRDQLVDDGLVKEEDWGDLVGAAAAYMRDCMFTAIGNTVVAARDVMSWLQETAAALAKVNKPFVWKTPAGSTICQAYHPWKTTRPLTAFGRILVASSVDRSSLKEKKQAIAAAPNFVHSFDAAHMALTINEGARQGITHWSMIHDSYGAHAANMGRLNRILRDEFVGIYQNDWLKQTHEGCLLMAPGATLTAPPIRGSFDITETRRSPWFFA